MLKNIIFLNTLLIVLLSFISSSIIRGQENNNGSFIINSADSIRIKNILDQSAEIKWQYPDSAMKLMQYAFDESIKIKYYDDAATAKINMGLATMGQGDFEGCFVYYKEAFYYIQKARNKVKLTSTLFIDIGATYFYSGNYEKAFLYYYATLQYMLKEKPDDNNIVMAYNNIADALIHMEQYDRASYYLDLGEKKVFERKSDDEYSYILANKADIAQIKGNFVAAESYNEKALALGLKYNNSEVAQAVYMSMGKSFLSQDKPRQAIAVLEKALGVNVKTYPYYSVIGPQYYLGLAYYNIGDYARAEESLVKALTKANKTGIVEDKLKAYSTLSSVYEKLGQYKNAMSVQHDYNKLKDSILNTKKIESVNKNEVRYRTAQKDKEIAEKKLLIEKQTRDIEHKNILMLGSIGGLLIVCIVSLIIYRNIQNRNRFTALKIRLDVEENERSRMAKELHDGIGGMMAALKMKLIAQNPGAINPDIMTLLNETSDEIRKTAHNLMPNVIEHFTLEDALTQYCQSINEPNSDLHIDLQILSPLNVINSSLKLAIYRIVQELMQNIIKHASATNVTIQIVRQDTTISILVEDNGKGFDPKIVKEGLGLGNLRARVKALRGNISFESEIGIGSTVNIEIDIAKI